MSTENISGGGAAGPVSAAAVAGLAREVDALRRRLAPLDGLDGRVTDLANTVADLADELAARGRRNAGGAPSWLALPDDPDRPDYAAGLLGELAVWVGQVYLRYADAAKGFPECWLWHPDVVEELVWLWHAWRQAYEGESAAVLLAADWHDRYRPGVVRRIDAAARACSLDLHLPTAYGAVGTPPTTPLASAVDDIADWWTHDRQGCPPAPTDAQIAQVTARLHRGGDLS